MFLKATVLWVVGLLTLVPYAAYYLFFEAAREQYALLIVFIAFWIFGYWGLVGIILSAMKMRRVFRAIELARSRDDFARALRSPDTRDVAIDMIATENHLPRFLAEYAYAWLMRRLAQASAAPPGPGA